MRERMSLDGIWKFCPAFQELETNQLFMDPDFNLNDQRKIQRERRDVGWIEPEFDDTGWLDIPVPHTWNKAIPDLWSYEGYGWYRRSVDIPADWEGRRVEFTCDSANYRTVLYVNGERAGVHEGGYTPFSIAIHRFLKFGETNKLAISVDNIPKPERCPGGEFGWWNYGGIYRSTGLLVTDMVCIDEFAVTTEPGEGRALVLVRVKVARERGENSDFKIIASVKDASGEEVVQSDCMLRLGGDVTEGEAELEVVKPLLWSTEEPNLYDLSLELFEAPSGRLRDRMQTRVGIRSIRVEGARLLLNGKPLLVKGVNRHPEYPVTGHMETEDALKKDLNLIKDLGANAIRCHYPSSPRTYELCDEMGILFLSEIPLYQWGRPEVKADSPKALDAAKAQLTEMIRYLRNHPSVFLWSVSNENMTKPRNDTDRYRELTEMTVAGNLELVDLAHRLDPTRPVVEASNCWPGDPVFERTDLCAVNLYVSASTPHVRTLSELSEKMHEKLEGLRAEWPEKPILITEFGSWAIRGLKTEYFPGETYQAALIRNYWEGLQEEPNFIGGFIWCFQDSDEHRRWEWDYEFRVAYGLFDLDRRPKESVEAVRRMWSSHV